jgi:hypothetical protein
MNPTPDRNDESRCRVSGRRRRHGWRRWLAALLIFGAGVVVGGVGMLALIHQRIAEHHRLPPDRVADRMMDRMERRLDLSEEQTARIRPILESRLAALQDIRDEVIPRVSAQLAAAREAVAAELTPAQEEKWRKHVSRFERMLPESPPEE